MGMAIHGMIPQGLDPPHGTGSTGSTGIPRPLNVLRASRHWPCCAPPLCHGNAHFWWGKKCVESAPPKTKTSTVKGLTVAKSWRKIKIWWNQSESVGKHRCNYWILGVSNQFLEVVGFTYLQQNQWPWESPLMNFLDFCWISMLRNWGLFRVENSQLHCL